MDYNITLSNQLYYTIYLFQNNRAFFPQIVKGRFLCLLSSRSDNSPKTLPRLFPANESPSHFSCSSNQYIMATSSYMSFLFSNTLTMLFKHSTVVFTHIQLNGNLSGNSYLFTQLIPELPIFVSHRSALLPPKWQTRVSHELLCYQRQHAGPIRVPHLQHLPHLVREKTDL